MTEDRPNARAVYRIFNAELRPVLSPLGYRRWPGAQGSWVRQVSTGFLLLEVAASRWGWQELIGTTVGWTYSHVPALTDAGLQASHALDFEEAYGDGTLLELQTLVKGFLTALPPVDAEQYLATGQGNRSDLELLLRMRRVPQLTALRAGWPVPCYGTPDLVALANWVADQHAEAETRALRVLGADRE